MMHIKKIELDKDKILKQLTAISQIVEKDDWKLEYDSELDELFFGKEVMPKGSFLFNVNDELNLFVTSSSKVNGIFVEYFALNFIQHNKKLKPVLEALANGKKGDKVKGELAKEALEGTLLTQAIGSVFNRKKLIAAMV